MGRVFNALHTYWEYGEVKYILWVFPERPEDVLTDKYSCAHRKIRWRGSEEEIRYKYTVRYRGKSQKYRPF
jgi:hypothetical protein